MADLSSPDSFPDDEVVGLVDGLIDGHLDEESQRRLEELLKSDPRLADYCAERILFNSKLADLVAPSRLELIQNRRLLIEGNGEDRRVVVGQSQMAQIGGRSGDLFLAGPEGKSRPSWWMSALPWSLAALFAVGAFFVWSFQNRPAPETVFPEQVSTRAAGATPWFRKPTSASETKYWLQNMAWHRFSLNEMKAATGLPKDEISSALEKYGIKDEAPTLKDDKLLVLPYPGGRHPRLGYQKHAVNPRRDTKISVFTPWDADGYVVLDVPEAINLDRFVYYLSHSDLPTFWSLQGYQLPPLEWERHEDGKLSYERHFPNGVSFGAEVTPGKSELRLQAWLRNESASELRNVNLQNCVLLGRAEGFSEQSMDNKVFKDGFAAARSADGQRWAIVSWGETARPWGISECPCIHSDPRIKVCHPGETVELRGWFSFYEGADLDAELERIKSVGWVGGL
ncbi:hypothetical protein [Roseibacillus persicicus]|uniref:hypothetical protein n=1 Tax=Roseibacillus persicicus TaxID=454148 RepID=UPI00281039B7|nr:hypothetical protein [Roseibacillus persicicus]MDQ8189024.1 hypothetical protein [Roseibacillus persicicus]